MQSFVVCRVRMCACVIFFSPTAASDQLLFLQSEQKWNDFLLRICQVGGAVERDTFATDLFRELFVGLKPEITRCSWSNTWLSFFLLLLLLFFRSLDSHWHSSRHSALAVRRFLHCRLKKASSHGPLFSDSSLLLNDVSLRLSLQLLYHVWSPFLSFPP